MRGEIEETTRPVRFQGLYLWMQSLVVVLLPVILVLSFVGGPLRVQMASMTPTLLEGDQMVVRSIFYSPQRGDVVVFARHDFQDGQAIVKRVIALEGDVVDINTETGIVYLNGQALYEPFTNGPTNRAGDMSYPFTVPEGHVFVIGDNRNNSMDSRHTEIGPVDEREIIGQVVAVILPFSRVGLIRG